MLPFVFVDTVRIGFYPVNPFGVMVALGFLVWDSVATRRAKELGYDTRKFRSLQLWGLGMGLVIAHVVNQVFYFPEQLLARPWALLFFWEGMSSVGGMIGAAVGAILWKRYEWRRAGPIWRPARRAEPLPLLPFAEVIVAAMPIGFAFGRGGCALIHDHPGIAVSPHNPLSVAFPAFEGDGGVPWSFGPFHFLRGSDPRLDLGLLECLCFTALVFAIAVLWKRRYPLGTYIGIVCVAYGPVRFVLDFFRLETLDRRLLGLTFAQWVALSLIAFGAWMLRRARRAERAVSTQLLAVNAESDSVPS